MNVVRRLSLSMLVVVGAYTLAVVARHGTGLVPVFVGDVLAVTWSGQFNADFACYLLLSALWLAWRHDFSPGGFALAVPAAVLGIVFLAAYLLYQSFRVGSVEELLLGSRRVTAYRER